MKHPGRTPLPPTTTDPSRPKGVRAPAPEVGHPTRRAALHHRPPASTGRRRRLPAIVLVVLAMIATALAGVQAPAARADAGGTAPGVLADYYLLDTTDGNHFGEHRGTAVEPDVDVPNMAPLYQRYTGRHTQVGVRWAGSIVVPADGTYAFTATGPTGFRMSIDGRQIIDWWSNKGGQPPSSAPIHLDKGAHQFRFEQFHITDYPSAELEWTGPGIDQQAIPAAAFRLPSGYHGVQATIDVDRTGRTVTATFDNTLTGHIDPSDLAVYVGETVNRVSGARTRGRTLTVTMDAPLQKDARIRLGYNGRSRLSLGADRLEAFELPAVNHSAQAMTTRWTSRVNRNHPLPEYPRPQLVRSRWQNLNGQWGLTTLTKGQPAPVNTTDGSYRQRATVPYPIESPLSGIGHHEDYFAYRRTFTVPARWRAAGQRIELHFGAVDYDATVLVNGTEVAHHVGGYEEFSADITAALHQGRNELVVQVADLGPDQPRGKQSYNAPFGIFHTATSGIWQTVWMEPVARASLTGVSYSTDLGSGTLTVTPSGTSAARGATAQVTVSDGHRVVGTARGRIGSPIPVAIRHPHLWSPDDPHLYSVAISTGSDHVSSYAGMRTISIGDVDGVRKILLNGRPTFLLSALDQGYWPDGVYTAPTDRAMAFDIEQTKEFGFNTIRKHLKVEPARWYYQADRIGMLVWQDMPANGDGNGTPKARAQYTSELHQIVAQHMWSASVIGWVPFNEGWGEWSKDATGQIARSVKAQDPSRLVDANSGVNCCQSRGDSGAGDVIDWHTYLGPATPSPDATRAAVDGEHGGLTLTVPGHTWPGGAVNPNPAGYDADALTADYVKNTTPLVEAARGTLSGAVYTENIDAEGETSGLWTYDRQVQKMDKPTVRRINQEVIAAGSRPRR